MIVKVLVPVPRVTVMEVTAEAGMEIELVPAPVMVMLLEPADEIIEG